MVKKPFLQQTFPELLGSIKKAKLPGFISGFFDSADKSPGVTIQNISPPGYRNDIFNGDKFYGGFGQTDNLLIDYWTLRRRSAQLFNTNLYAKGLLRRLITNEISTGLAVEATPDEGILKVAEGSLDNWTEDVETRFALWGKNKKVSDYKQISSFGAQQAQARLEALIEGDVLCVLRFSQVTRLPSVQLISGGKVQTPLGSLDRVRKGNKVQHGVETNPQGRIVAYWVRQDDGQIKRMPAVGEKSGRVIAWLEYGTEKRLDDLRGQPLLSIVLQSLKEVDRYRDSTQRKAVINSILAMFIKKGENQFGSLPVTGGAVKNTAAAVTDADGTARSFKIAEHIPGLVMEELQQGEEPVAFGNQGTDTSFGTFEEAIIQAVAWANEIPPEILRLAFSNNYSASQAAINEFKIYLDKVRYRFGETFCQPVYTEWLISETLNGKITAPGLIEAWRDISQHDIFGAWVNTEWYGQTKPSTDMFKQAKGSELLLNMGLTTHTRESRYTTGTKFSKNTKRLKKENEQLAAALTPLAEFKQKFASTPGDETETVGAVLTAIENLTAEINSRENL